MPTRIHRTALNLIVFSILLSQISASCTNQSLSCDPLPSCCPPGQVCNFIRGIPWCENAELPLTSGWVDTRCVDPYLFDCSGVLQISGFCCAIGSICYNSGINDVVSCIDAYGNISTALHSNTQNYVPKTILNHNNQLSPQDAWKSTPSALNCTMTGSIQTTSTLNSTISFNYTGQSVLIHMVKSPGGGALSVAIDGVPMNDTIDTFNADGESCYPVQFPPFIKPPPGFGSRKNHSITLTFIGPSDKAPNGTTSSNVQFDAFATPEFNISPAAKLAPTQGVYQIVLVLLVYWWQTQ